jgi:hypothetical protein
VSVLQRVPVPAPPHESIGRAQLEVPAGHVAALVLDVDVDARVGVGPLQPRHGAGERDRLVAIELRRERMVSLETTRQCHHESGQQDERTASHQSILRYDLATTRNTEPFVGMIP